MKKPVWRFQTQCVCAFCTGEPTETLHANTALRPELSRSLTVMVQLRFSYGRHNNNDGGPTTAVVCTQIPLEFKRKPDGRSRAPFPVRLRTTHAPQQTADFGQQESGLIGRFRLGSVISTVAEPCVLAVGPWCWHWHQNKGHLSNATG